MIMNKIFEDLVRTEYADVKVFSFLTGCTSSLLRSQDTVIWSYWQTPRIHAGKLCKVGMPIERISTGNICSREAGPGRRSEVLLRMGSPGLSCQV